MNWSAAPHVSVRDCFGVCALFWCWVSLCVPYTNSLMKFYFIMIVVIIIEIVIAILFILNYTFRLSTTTQFWFCKCALLWMFPPPDIPFEYVPFGILDVMFRLSTSIFYRGVPGFATDCPNSGWWSCLETPRPAIATGFRHMKQFAHNR